MDELIQEDEEAQGTDQAAGQLKPPPRQEGVEQKEVDPDVVMSNADLSRKRGSEMTAPVGTAKHFHFMQLETPFQLPCMIFPRAHHLSMTQRR